MSRLPLPSLVSLVAAAWVLAPLDAAPAQDAPKPPTNGPRRIDPGWHAIVGATVIAEPGRRIENATVVIRDGTIRSVAADGAPPPAGARVWSAERRTVYAAFVDPHVPVDTPGPAADAPGRHWHDEVTPERSALDGDAMTEALAKKLRALGFGAAAIAPRGGIFRGRAAVVQLSALEEDESRPVLRDDVYQSVGFERSRGSNPSSLMGAIAVVRQTLCDADAFAARTAANPAPAAMRSLGALRSSGTFAFDTDDELDALRAARVAEEFEHLIGRAVVIGSGTEFRRLDAIRATALPVLLPLRFPAAPAVDTISAQEATTLRDMWTWEQAPTNPARLAAAGVEVALTTAKLDKGDDFWKNLRKAIEHGLPREKALAMLTTAPARLCGIDDRLGKVAPGYAANLLVVDGDVFDDDAKRREIWIGGRRHELVAPDGPELAGRWDAALRLGDLTIQTLSFSDEKKLELLAGDGKVKAKKLVRRPRQIEFVFDTTPLGGDGVAVAHAVLRGSRMMGTVVAADGARAAWTARRSDEPIVVDAALEKTAPDVTDTERPDTEQQAAERTDTEAPAPPEGPPVDLARPLPTPLGAYGLLETPPARRVRVHGITLWTSGPRGIVDDGVLLVRDGKVEFAGPASEAPADFDAELEIDGAGRLHVTPGLIDCHSHTGISRGVNEGSQAVTSEVRIGDVVDPDDIGWYRELAGGVTAVNQLHGSANPIGGQNSVVKLRWGVGDPEAMKLQGAPPGIKFALGENVKRSRSRDSTRYPRTRMGVETLIRDRFVAAREYAAAWRRFGALPDGESKAAKRPRRDLELEALAEILAGERLVHCHSYRQDEILMLCRVATDFGFRIGTFQHGLECYKVAEAVKEASRGASIFTDWWAYKFEVFDAIPNNAEILHGVGVTVSFNSDSNELARRLNTEAAKAVKYGGVPRAEALKMVTLNPAFQLGVDDRIGSLEPDKDADFVVWSGDPLSGFSRCLRTFVDGREYWSEERHQGLRDLAHAERRRLVQKLLTVADEERAVARQRDEDTLDNKPGECGCSREEVW